MIEPASANQFLDSAEQPHGGVNYKANQCNGWHHDRGRKHDNLVPGYFLFHGPDTLEQLKPAREIPVAGCFHGRAKSDFGVAGRTGPRVRRSKPVPIHFRGVAEEWKWSERAATLQSIRRRQWNALKKGMFLSPPRTADRRCSVDPRSGRAATSLRGQSPIAGYRSNARPESPANPESSEQSRRATTEQTSPRPRIAEASAFLKDEKSAAVRAFASLRPARSNGGWLPVGH